MLNYKKILMILIIFALSIINCATQTILWKGKYITIETDSKPKEDFKVGKYIVIAYASVEYEKNYDALYKFAFILNGRQIKLINLVYYPDWSEWVNLRSFYTLEEEIDIDYEFIEEYDYAKRGLVRRLGKEKTLLLYKVYIEQPIYEEVKKDITAILSGRIIYQPPGE
ncbi:hypothetical protein KAX08_09830 [candidate division WOR-3 bacterium]|nr:hypothetical protein [candidate division WOR-3 bacterium]